jgi:hypothetical protein
MKKELLKLLPSEQELAQLSSKVKVTMTNRNELLAQIGKLDLDKIELEEKMVYVLGLISLGFDQSRARKRLEVPGSHFYIWKQDPRHKAMLESSEARGELILEEEVLAGAEKNPELALRVLKEKQRIKEKKEDVQIEKTRTVWDIMQRSAKERGLDSEPIEGELVDDVLK